MNEIEKEITVYRPNQRHELGYFAVWGVVFRNIIQARDLVWQLFKRDFLAQYKKSFLGYAWIIVTPLLGVVSWILMEVGGVLKPGDVGVPYPVYVLIGTSMWGLFQGLVQSASQTLESGSGLVMQVKYPHEALLFKQVAQYLATFLVSFSFNLVVVFSFGVVPSWKIVFLPLVVLPIFLLAASVGLVFSLIAVVALDLKNVVALGIGLLMYFTPVIYSARVESPLLGTIIKWNPLTYLVCSARDLILFGNLYHPQAYFIISGGCLVLFMLSWRLFFIAEERVIERML